MNGELHLITNSKWVQSLPSFENVIGQTAVVRKLTFFIETHDVRNPFPNTLFTGSHGLGKTYVAEKVAKSLGRRFISENCGLMGKEKDLVSSVLLGRVMGSTPATLFLDEAHRLSAETTTVLLSLLNPNPTMKNSIHYKDWDIVFDMAQINVIMATTDVHMMFRPLVERCEKVYFESYSVEDLIAMLRLYCPLVEFNCNEIELAEACRGRGRDAYTMAQKINRYLGTKKLQEKTILTNDGWKTLKNIFEIYPKGLNRQEVELLKVINKFGTISSGNIASAMMVNIDNVESELEVRPRELGLIQSTTRGRVLTVEGKQYLEGLKK